MMSARVRPTRLSEHARPDNEGSGHVHVARVTRPDPPDVWRPDASAGRARDYAIARQWVCSGVMHSCVVSRRLVMGHVMRVDHRGTRRARRTTAPVVGSTSAPAPPLAGDAGTRGNTGQRTAGTGRHACCGVAPAPSDARHLISDHCAWCFASRIARER